MERKEENKDVDDDEAASPTTGFLPLGSVNRCAQLLQGKQDWICSESATGKRILLCFCLFYIRRYLTNSSVCINDMLLQDERLCHVIKVLYAAIRPMDARANTEFTIFFFFFGVFL